MPKPNADSNPTPEPDPQRDAAFKRRRGKRLSDEDDMFQEGGGSVQGEPPQADVEPGQMAQLIVDAREGAVDREAAGAIARPLGDLAQAFAVQAEILKGVHESQVRLSESIQDDSKQELMLNSTEALNDTFKGVRSTQHELLDELRRERQGKKVLLYGIGGLAIAVIVIAGFFAQQVFESKDKIDERDNSSLEARMAGIEGDVLPKYENMNVELRADRDAKVKELAEVRADRDARKLRIAEMQRELDTLNGERGNDDEELRKLRDQTARDSATIEELRRRVDSLDRDVTTYMKRAEVAEAKATRLNDQILTRLKQEGSKFLTEINADAPPQIVDGVDDAVKNALAKQKTAKKEKEAAANRPVDSVKADLNRLLSKPRQHGVFQVESIGSIGEGVLNDVVFTVTNPGRGVIKHIEAGKLRIAVASDGDIVELFFDGGKVRRWSQGLQGLGKASPFYKGKMRLDLLVLNGDEWLSRRESFIDVP